MGLFKQWEVSKVKKEITHSQCASDVHIYVDPRKYAVISQQQREEREILSL